MRSARAAAAAVVAPSALALALALVVALGAGRPARAETPPPSPPEPAAAAAPAATATAPAPPAGSPAPAEPDEPDEVDADNDVPGYMPSEASSASSALHVNGYVDIGFAKAQGDGTSFAPGDMRVPADYGVDTFAPAVNSRGDVASTDSKGLFENGFLPRSVGIAGRPSILLNTVDLDLRYQPLSSPFMVFTRVQFLPRLSGDGDATRVLVEQAFGRVMPFETQDLALSAGKFDSVFGIEYLDNQANIRTGVTPSLAARYTTGQSIGAKISYRLQIAPIASAVSLNASATNSGNMVESLQPPDGSLTGEPVFAARLGYELSPRVVQVKLGASGLLGPRNDQQFRGAHQKLWGADLRVYVAGLAFAGEIVHVEEDEGFGPKTTSLGTFPEASGFYARAMWGQLAYAFALDAGPLRRLTPYVRYEWRHAFFEGFVPITVDRITAGLRIDLLDNLILKGELLINRELQGAPEVPNNVYTSSVVFQW